MSTELQRPAPIEIKLGNAPLDVKLDAIAGTLSFVKEAHRDEMSPRAWAAIGRAQDALAEAMLTRNEGRCMLLENAAARMGLTLKKP